MLLLTWPLNHPNVSHQLGNQKVVEIAGHIGLLLCVKFLRTTL